MSAQLRDTQRRHGLVAVREEILNLLGRYRQTKIPPHRVARMLDVPPDRIDRWIEVKDQLDTDRMLSIDPRIRAARRLAEIEDQKAQCAEHTIKPSGQNSFAAIMGLQTRLRADEHKLLEIAGLNRFTIDQRDAGTRKIHDTLAEMFEPLMAAYQVIDEAGTDPDFPTSPEGIAEARSAYAEFREEFPGTHLPEFMEDDPWGWRPTAQRSRTIKARKLAAGRKDHEGHRPGEDDVPIPGVDYLPPDVSEIAEALRCRAEQQEHAELELPPDVPEGDGETGCTEAVPA